MRAPSSPPRPRLTVLQVIPRLEAGGAERTTLDIAAALVARGDRAIVASRGGRMEAELTEAGGELVRLPMNAKDPVRILRSAGTLKRLIRAEGVDIVHARSRAPAWSALIACRATGAKFVTTYHGIYGETNALKRLYNSVMVRADAVIANSHHTAGIIGERYGTTDGRVRVIHRGIDLARFDRAAITADRIEALRRAWQVSSHDRIVLSLARLTGWKGQAVLIEALAGPELARPNLVLVLAGDEQGRTGYRAELQALAERLGVAGRVRIVGHCEDVPAALSLADVSAVASVEPEAFGRAAVEAQAMGVPVVVTDLGAAAETVRAPPDVDPKARTGWRVPPGDPAAIARALAEALDLAPAERESLAARARAHAGSFSLGRMTGDTLALYDRLVSRRGHNGTLS